MKKTAIIACSVFIGFFIGYAFDTPKCDFLKNLPFEKKISDKISDIKKSNNLSEGEEQIVSIPEILKNCPDDMRPAILLRIILNLVKSEYVTELPDDQIAEKAISGLFSSLDPHSRYITPKNMDQYDDIKDGEFAGIGTNVIVDENFIRIISVLDDTPAYKAGLKSGDLIIYIDDNCTHNMTLEEASKKLRGKAKTKVKLKIKRRKKNPFDVTIMRDTIKIPSIKCEYSDGVCCLRISIFSKNTTENLKKILSGLKNKKEKIRGIVLDLRNNPGGLMDEAVGVADAFLDEGKLIVYSKGRHEEENEIFKSTGKDLTNNLPLAILIDSGTISAPEIVAGALQDHKRAIIVGNRSFGKGSVQKLFPVSEKSAIKLTVARYYIPSGKSIQSKGITPDIEAELAVLNRLQDPFVVREELYDNALDANKNVKNKKLSDEENKRSLDELEKHDNKNRKEEEEDQELRFRDMSLKDRIKYDYQLEKAFDVIKTIDKYSDLLKSNNEDEKKK